MSIGWEVPIARVKRSIMMRIRGTWASICGEELIVRPVVPGGGGSRKGSWERDAWRMNLVKLGGELVSLISAERNARLRTHDGADIIHPGKTRGVCLIPFWSSGKGLPTTLGLASVLRFPGEAMQLPVQSDS